MAGFGAALYEFGKSVPGIVKSFDDEEERKRKRRMEDLTFAQELESVTGANRDKQTDRELRAEALANLGKWEKDRATGESLKSQMDEAEGPLPASTGFSTSNPLNKMADAPILDSMRDYGVTKGAGYDKGIEKLVDIESKRAEADKKASDTVQPFMSGSEEYKIADAVASGRMPFQRALQAYAGFGNKTGKREGLISTILSINPQFDFTQGELDLAGKITETKKLASLTPGVIDKEGDRAAVVAGNTEAARGAAKANTPEFVAKRTEEWNKTIKDYNEAYQQYSMGKTAPDSPTGDVAAINALEKVREINSAVMFGDFEKWRRAGTLWADVIQSGAWDAANNRVIQGRIPPEKMKDIQGLLDGLFSNRVEFLNVSRNRAADIAKRDFKWDDERVSRVYTLPKLGTSEGARPEVTKTLPDGRVVKKVPGGWELVEP